MRELIEKLLDGHDLHEEEARRLLEEMTSPETDAVLTAAALTALRAKGESADEVRGFALGLRGLAVRPDIPPDTPAVDIVGTGGDGSGSLNISTGSALLAAAAGLPIVKHGNRSVSSRSGSADVLEALGLPVPLGPEAAGRLFEGTGFTFLFAPAYHPAMKSVAPIRRGLGIRTIFNVAGPLANPATPPFHVIGAFSSDMAEIMADTLAGMPIERAFVVHGEPGWDEATPVGEYRLLDVRPGSVVDTIEDPAELGFERCTPEDLAGADAQSNADAITEVFAGHQGPHRDALVLGAALAMRVTGESPEDAARRARAAIDDGSAARLLTSLNHGSDV